jgi:photosystem II stability/assembly factor-like uncharacterized protein
MSRARSLCLALLLVAGCGDDEPIVHYDLSVDYDLAVRDMAVPPDLTRPTWRPQVVPVTTSLYAIGGAAGEVFAVGDRGVILRTDDGGVHWHLQDGGTTAALFGVWTDGATTIAVGYHGTILRSVDDGASWQASVVGSATLRAVAGTQVGDDGGSATHVWAVGEAGTVLQSLDGGISWTALTTPAAGVLYGVSASPAETFVIGKNLVRTRDEGATWTQLSDGSGLAVWASGSGQLVYAGAQSLSRSRDGGLTWGSVPLGATRVGANVVGFAAFTDGELWAAMSNGDLRHVVNDFDTEVGDDEAALGQPLAAIWGSDPGNLFVVGDNGFVAHRE